MIPIPSLAGGRAAPLLLAGLLLLAPVSGLAFDVPANDGFLTDTVGIIDETDAVILENTLTKYRSETSNEIAVVILKTLDGEPIENAALEIGRKWGVGSSKDNGILILVAYEESEIRLEVGYGLEGAVPDIVAKGIIDNDMFPMFREGDYAAGIGRAVESLRKHIGGEYTADRYQSGGEENSVPGAAFFFGLILLQWLIAILGRTKSWWLGGVFGALGGFLLALIFGWWLSIPLLIPLGLLLDFIVSQNYHRRGATAWWAGGAWGPGRSGSSGGGFGGFGGGSFGGGGASGRW